MSTSAWIGDTDLTNFEQDVLEASFKQPLLVDFWADWCSPCHGLVPHLNRFIEKQKGEIQLLKYEVDVGDNMKKAGFYKLRGFPTVILFSKGEEISRFHGMRSTAWIENWYAEALANLD